jgi:hypothetical protein
MIYCNSGHNAMDYAKNIGTSQTWANQQHVTLIVNAMAWLAGASTTGFGGAEKPGSGGERATIAYGPEGLKVSWPGAEAFRVSVLDPSGRLVARRQGLGGGIATGGPVRLAPGAYVVSAEDRDAGKASGMIRVP